MAAGPFGAALIYGDGIITPAISVLTVVAETYPYLVMVWLNPSWPGEVPRLSGTFFGS